MIGLLTIDEYLAQLEISDEKDKIRYFLNIDDLSKYIRFTDIGDKYDGIFYGTLDYNSYYFRDDVVNFFHKFEKYDFVFDFLTTAENYNENNFMIELNYNNGSSFVDTAFDHCNLNCIYLLEDFMNKHKYSNIFIKHMKKHTQYMTKSPDKLITINNLYVFDRVQYLLSIPIIEELDKKIKHLEDQIKYSPGGEGFYETQEHFHSLL